jgi:hypothetical protein
VLSIDLYERPTALRSGETAAECGEKAPENRLKTISAQRDIVTKLHLANPGKKIYPPTSLMRNVETAFGTCFGCG